MFVINNPGQNIRRHFEKGQKAEEGETRDWKGGKFRKQGGKWVEVNDPKGKKGEEEPGDKNPSEGGEGVPMDKHEVAQITLMKELVNSDSSKAYEIFQSLSPEAQSHIPQDVVTKLVKEDHKQSEEGSDVWDNAGKKETEKKKALDTLGVKKK
jgi:hypothetical protein